MGHGLLWKKKGIGHRRVRLCLLFFHSFFSYLLRCDDGPISSLVNENATFPYHGVEQSAFWHEAISNSSIGVPSSWTHKRTKRSLCHSSCRQILAPVTRPPSRPADLHCTAWLCHRCVIPLPSCRQGHQEKRTASCPRAPSCMPGLVVKGQRGGDRRNSLGEPLEASSLCVVSLRWCPIKCPSVAANAMLYNYLQAWSLLKQNVGNSDPAGVTRQTRGQDSRRVSQAQATNEG